MLNQEQRRYTLRRIDGISDEKCRSIAESTDSQKRKPLDLEEKLQLIRNGQVDLDPGKVVLDQRWKEPHVSDCFIFPSELGMLEYNDDLEHKKHVRQQLVRTHARRLRDQIILGSPEDALALIEEFELQEF